MISVQHNMLAENANRQFNVNTKKNAKIAEALSSGYRINRTANNIKDGIGIADCQRLLDTNLLIMIGFFRQHLLSGKAAFYLRWLGSDKTWASFVLFILLFMFYQIIEASFEGIY